MIRFLYHVCITEKPGVCPSNNFRYCFRSENHCFHDSNCPDDLKCCSDGCGRQCMTPNRGIYIIIISLSSCSKSLRDLVYLSCVRMAEKPGVCPINNLRIGVCAELCSHDGDCPNDEKCCSNGCGHQCTALSIGMLY